VAGDWKHKQIVIACIVEDKDGSLFDSALSGKDK
jgi:hypothetical protein